MMWRNINIFLYPSARLVRSPTQRLELKQNLHRPATSKNFKIHKTIQSTGICIHKTRRPQCSASLPANCPPSTLSNTTNKNINLPYHTIPYHTGYHHPCFNFIPPKLRSTTLSIQKKNALLLPWPPFVDFDLGKQTQPSSAISHFR